MQERERKSAILMHETLDVHPSERRLSLPERKSETKSKNKYKRVKNKDNEERNKLSHTAIRFNTPHGT